MEAYKKQTESDNSLLPLPVLLTSTASLWQKLMENL